MLTRLWPFNWWQLRGLSTVYVGCSSAFDLIICLVYDRIVSLLVLFFPPTHPSTFLLATRFRFRFLELNSNFYFHKS